MSHKPRQGSLHSQMRRAVKEHTKDRSNHTRKSYIQACACFDRWRRENGYSNADIRRHPRDAVEAWRDHMLDEGYSVGTIHTYASGICCGLQIPMDGIIRSGNAMDKTKSLGLSRRSQLAMADPKNAEIIRFQRMVGGRRTALQRLTGSDLVERDGGLYIRFLRDKGGKNQLQYILPEDAEQVRAYFESVGPEERLFPEPFHRDLDLHLLRAEHARRVYAHFARLCSTEEGRAELRRRLWQRYTDPVYGCKAYLEAQRTGNQEAMRALRIRYAAEMADGPYYLRGPNRRVARERGLPIVYDRLAILSCSVFALSHWRTDIAVKSYLL